MSDFEDFVRARGPHLLRTAYLLTRDWQLAEDLVQESLAKAHVHWGRVRVADHPEAYVRRVLVNQFLDWRSRRSSREVVSAVESLPTKQQEDGADQRAEHDVLWAALARLPARQRAVLVLRHFEDLPDREIAALLECTDSTVRSLAAKARTQLRDAPGVAVYPGGQHGF